MLLEEISSYLIYCGFTYLLNYWIKSLYFLGEIIQSYNDMITVFFRFPFSSVLYV